MSNAPLFQNTDDQEEAYAPQELPTGDAEKQMANLDDRDRGTGSGDGAVPVPGAGLVGQMGGGAMSSQMGGSPGAIGTAVGGDVAGTGRDNLRSGGHVLDATSDHQDAARRRANDLNDDDAS